MKNNITNVIRIRGFLLLTKNGVVSEHETFAEATEAASKLSEESADICIQQWSEAAGGVEFVYDAINSTWKLK